MSITRNNLGQTVRIQDITNSFKHRVEGDVHVNIKIAYKYKIRKLTDIYNFQSITKVSKIYGEELGGQ